MNLKKKMTPLVMAGILSAPAFAAPAPGASEDSAPSAHRFSVGLITNYYKYRETVDNKYFMSLKGYMIGGTFNYLYTANNNFFVGTDFDIAGGSANYNSKGTGSAKNETQFKTEARVKFGKNFEVSDNTILSPYAGFGIRYKSDYSGGKKTSTGKYGYDRDSTYFYLPVGLKMTNRLTNDWSMESTGEFDIFLGGINRSKHKCHTDNHEQRKGFGARGAVEFVKPLPKNKAISFGPYVNYWNIKDSKKNYYSSGRYMVWTREPHNTTVEAGLGIKYRF